MHKKIKNEKIDRTRLRVRLLRTKKLLEKKNSRNLTKFVRQDTNEDTLDTVGSLLVLILICLVIFLQFMAEWEKGQNFEINFLGICNSTFTLRDK